MAWKTLHFEWENDENRWKMGPKTSHFPAWQLKSLPLPGDWWRLTESLDLIKAGGQTVEKVEQLLNDEDWRAHCEARLTCPLEQPWCDEHPNIQWISNEHPFATTMNHVYELFPFLFVQGRTCVVAFLPHIFDDGAAGRNDKIKVETISRFRRFWWFRPFK